MEMPSHIISECERATCISMWTVTVRLSFYLSLMSVRYAIKPPGLGFFASVEDTEAGKGIEPLSHECRVERLTCYDGEVSKT